MKSNGSLIVMGFLVVGLWYAIGYVQGSDSVSEATIDELLKEYERGKQKGLDEATTEAQTKSEA